MLRPILLAVTVLFGSGGAFAQGIMSDLMSGKLVNPKPGVFAWYNLKDTATGSEYYLRQAIVGEERVKRKDAYWLETELIPKVGYPSVYKMLLTGPASEPDNVHRLLFREGTGVVQEVALEDGERGGGDSDLPRELVGTEMIQTPGGEIEAEHFIVGEGDDQSEIWVSDSVPPMGLVRMRTAQGELTLQRFGEGGKDGQSALPTPGLPSGERSATQPEEASGPDDVKGDEGKRVRTNFGTRRQGRR